MILPSLFVVVMVASGLLFVWFSSISKSTIWRAAAFLSLGIAFVRVFASSAGRLILMNESSWLQIPAFAMVLASLPEAALASRLQNLSLASSVLLGFVILLGTSIWIFTIAAIAYGRKR